MELLYVELLPDVTIGWFFWPGKSGTKDAYWQVDCNLLGLYMPSIDFHLIKWLPHRCPSGAVFVVMRGGVQSMAWRPLNLSQSIQAGI